MTLFMLFTQYVDVINTSLISWRTWTGPCVWRCRFRCEVDCGNVNGDHV